MRISRRAVFDVQNKGLVLQPLFLLFFDLYSSKQNFINDVSLTIGDWNSVHTAIAGSGPKPGHWNETDVLTGLTVKFFKDLQFDAFYTGFFSQVDAFETSQNLRQLECLCGGPILLPHQ